jgi:hypothetical protein
MAIYKYPSTTENSVMPFVYTCPAPKTILNRLDKLFVYGNYEEIKLAESQLTLPFVIMENRAKRLGLLDCVAYGRYLFLCPYPFESPSCAGDFPLSENA